METPSHPQSTGKPSARRALRDDLAKPCKFGTVLRTAIVKQMRPPSVDRLARELATEASLRDLPLPLLVDAARAAIRDSPEDALRAGRAAAQRRKRSFLGDVINATGVLLHTNLGRSPLAGADTTGPVRASNLEFDLATGQRGSRRDHTGPLLAQLCGAEAALVVNNCAAALVLVLAAMAKGRAVVVSRGELVEIGGGFRIPDVLEQSGARLVEVGTTNRTRKADYEKAIAANFDVAMTLKVHTSNYRITGFVEEVDIPELATLGVPVVADIGSGLLDHRTPWLADASGRVPSLPWLAGEPAARDTLEAGADLVVFSCDKLMGGAQGGAIVGSKALVDLIAKHPLARALRPGGLVVRSLQETMLAYLRRDLTALPFWAHAVTSVDRLVARATTIAATVDLRWCSPIACESVPGGGTLPGVTIPSFGLRLDGNRARSLRDHDLPIIARTLDGATVLDLRTVDPLDDTVLATAIAASVVDSRKTAAADAEHASD